MRFSLPLAFACPAGAAANLVVLAHSLQCAGMAALIAWANTSLVRPLDVHGLGPLRSAVLMLRFITAFIVLHCFEILFWAGSYRSLNFHRAESAFDFSACPHTTMGYDGYRSPAMPCLGC
jgi:hypothetical protein